MGPRRGALLGAVFALILICGGEAAMSTILLIVLILLLLGALPAWPYSRDWGYYPTGGLGLLVIVLLVLIFMGRV
jgi:hypothetical protein